MKTNYIKGMLKYFWMDKVWVIAVLIIWIATFVDLFTKVDLTGLIGLYALILTSACLNIGYLKWLIKTKDEN